MMRSRGQRASATRWALIGCAALVAPRGSARAETEEPAPSTGAGTAVYAEAEAPAPRVEGVLSAEEDSLKTYAFGEILIAAPAPGIIADPGRTEIPEAVLEAHDVEDAEGLESLLPSANVGTNSRGEASLTLRGASERQVAIFQDGVRLNLSWDERIDLSLVPMDAIGSVNVVRGVGSVLDGPNTLGGAVHFVTRYLTQEGSRTRAVLEGGEVGRLRGGLFHLARRGDWSVLGSVEHRRRDGFLLPRGYEADFNQSSRRTRANSDLEETSIFARVARHLERDGTVSIGFQGIDASKGVPAETHLGGDDARYWRSPLWRRGLLSVQADLVPDEERLWMASGSLSLDLFEQIIQYYRDPSYLESAASGFETAEDATGEARIRVRRSRDREGTRSLSWAGSLRLAEHEQREHLGQTETYSQLLWGSALEWQGRIGEPWIVRAGAGVDGADTPKSADRPAQRSDLAPNLGIHLTRELSERAQLHAALGQRARFPSLRERYDDAGGVFAIAPELDAEVQTTLELGGGMLGERFSFSAGVFATRLEDGVVRVSLRDDNGERVRRRINAEEIRSAGFEVAGSLAAGRGWRLDAHYAYLHVRGEDENGDFDAPVERRPSYTAALAAQGSAPAVPGLELQVEGNLRGPFYSLDDRTGGFARVPSAITADVRISYRFLPRADRAWAGTAFLRVDNLADAEVLSQLGLPEPGRQLRCGLTWER